MLLRQLYLTHFEERRFARAVEVAEQMILLAVLPDVAHQDAARALQAAGDAEGAAGHLRLAARISPAARKAFHWWTLGSVYFLAGRYPRLIVAPSPAPPAGAPPTSPSIRATWPSPAARAGSPCPTCPR